METDDLIREQYDQTFFTGPPVALANPIHLATLATLFGMSPPPVGTSRILEIGCATGKNLLSIARELPDARLIGIDFSPAEIEAGRKEAAKESIRNVEFRAMSIVDLSIGDGEFDYIIAHGVFSWVPELVQQAILRICRENLSPQGVAYISYNAYPGRRAFEMVREMMLHHTARISSVEQRVAEARAILQVAAKSAPPGGAYSAMLSEEAQIVDSATDYLIVHDYLAPINQSFYFTEFNQLASNAGLQFLSESNPGAMLLSMFSPDAAAAVRRHALDMVDAEQYMDFFRNRRFRETLLCHAAISLDRRFNAERVSRMFVASSLRPSETKQGIADGKSVTFELPGGHKLTTATPLSKIAFLLLSEHYPKRIHFDELVKAARSRLQIQGISVSAGESDQLANDLFDGFLTNLVELQIE